MRGQQSPCGRAIQAPVPLTAPLQHPRPQPQGLGPAGPWQQHLDLEGKGGGQVCLISRVPPGPEDCLSRILSLRPSPPAPWGVMQAGLEGATGGGRGSRPAGLRRGGAEVGGLGGPRPWGWKLEEEVAGWGPGLLGCPPPGWPGQQVLAVLETGPCGQAHGVAAWSQGPWRCPCDVLLGHQAPSCARFVPLGTCPGLVPRPALGSPWGVAQASASDF